ncbi:MAG: hypothetical protein JWL62_1643 [Hyphomicrobiales bacterium]|nr:hypothetical protein [Hyphomicrobiales bacterium]
MGTPTQAAFLCLLAYAVASCGSVDLLPSSLLAVGLGLLIIFPRRPDPNAANIARLWLVCSVSLAFLAVAALAQSLRIDDNPFEHPAWNVVRESIRPISGAISLDPEQTRASIVTLSPALGFLVTIRLFSIRADAMRLLRQLCWLGAAVAAFGILQHIFFPSFLALGRKSFYLDSVTAFFVNRNSAGTFFGVGTLLALGMTLRHLRAINPSKLPERLFAQNSHQSQDYRRFAFFSCLTLLQGVALLLTQSRGAAGATFFAIVIFVFVMARQRLWEGTWTVLPQELSPLARLCVLVLAAAGAVALLSERSAYRMESGSDGARLCVFGSTLEATRNAWPLGSGLGTFQDVFPAYRDADCAGIAGVWEAAHNFYLEGALSLGLVFVVVVPVILFALTHAFLEGLRTRRRYRFVPSLGIAVLVLVGLHSLVDFSMQVPGVALYVAAILGCCATISLERARA